MKVKGKQKRPITIQFSEKEAKLLAKHLMDDVVWSDTADPMLFENLHDVLLGRFQS